MAVTAMASGTHASQASSRQEAVGAILVPRTVGTGEQRDGVGADGVETQPRSSNPAWPTTTLEADRDGGHHRELRHGAAEADSRCVEERWRKQRRQGTGPNPHTDDPLLPRQDPRPPPAQPGHRAPAPLALTARIGARHTWPSETFTEDPGGTDPAAPGPNRTKATTSPLVPENLPW